MEKMNDLKDLFKHEIEDLYSVEEQIIEALPKMIDKANNPNLKKALTEHLKLTEQHKVRLDKIMQTVDPEGSNGKSKGIFGGLFGGKQVCKGMKGIIEEGEKIMSADITPETLDAAIIASAQKVEHYEICGYGTARTFARELGMEQIAKQLEQTLNEEYAADDLLTQLAVQRINREAETGTEAASSASSRGRSAGRVKERAGKEEMEMEPVSSNRSRSAARNQTAENESKKNSGSERSGQPKASGTPRSEGSSRSSSSTKKTVSSSRGSKTSGRSNSRSSSNGRTTKTSRGRK